MIPFGNFPLPSPILVETKPLPSKPGENKTNCENGNFEEGSFSSAYSTYIANRYLLENPSNNTYQQVYIPNRHKIVTNGFDPEVANNLLPTVYEGNYAVRIGKSALGGGAATSMRYQFTVDQSNKNFSFNYALVMQDPGDSHNDWAKPYFQYGIISLQSGILTTKRFNSNINDPFFNVADGNITWKNWSSECFDLSDYIGETIIVFFETASCALGNENHFSYAYIDELCTDNEPTPRFHIPNNLCKDKPVIMYGASSQKEDSYYISIQKSDGNWQSIGPEYSKWFVAQQISQVNLTNLISELGGEFECNSHYRIKLAVGNGCVPWKDITKQIYIRCPDVPKLEDVYACCALFNDAIFLGFDTTNNTYDGYSFDWTAVDPIPNYFDAIGDGEQISTVPYFNGPALTNSTFSVNIRDNYGCSETQETTLWLIDDFDITIEELSDLQDCCSKTYKLNITYLNNCVSEQPSAEVSDEIFDITWSTGQTGQTINVGDNYSHNIIATVANKCGIDKTDLIVHTPVSTSGLNYVENFIAPNTILPNSNIPINRVLTISAYGPNVPYSGNTTDDAYGISWYELVVFDRDGHIVKTIKDSIENTPNCFFYQDQIRWDGTDENGDILPDGTYNYYLNVKTCSNPNEQRVCSIETNKLCKTKCRRWEWSLFIPYRDWYCCEYYEQGAEGNPSGDNQCIYYVQILN